MSTDFFRFRTGAAVGLLLIAAAAPMAHGLPLDDELQRVSINELKRVYLLCDREATNGQLSTDGIMNCSIVYEELKRRAFGSDFEKFRVWSSAMPSEGKAGR